MKRPRSTTAGAMQLQMTPMIDVVFQLLIFFVCTTSFQTVEMILPTLLSTSGGTSSQEVPLDPELSELEDVVIKLLRAGKETQWQINDRTYLQFGQVRDLLAALAKARRDLPVILNVQATVPLGDVIDVYDLCRIVGFDRIQFAAQTRR